MIEILYFKLHRSQQQHSAALKVFFNFLFEFLQLKPQLTELLLQCYYLRYELLLHCFGDSAAEEIAEVLCDTAETHAAAGDVASAFSAATAALQHLPKFHWRSAKVATVS